MSSVDSSPSGALPPTPPRFAGSKAVSERKLIFLLASVQFINIMDFMMVMPLGPDFARALSIPLDQLGLVAGSYTASAAIAGLVGSQFLDRFDRRRALFLAMIGLVAGTAAGGLATSLGTMLLARVIAGAFGGPATALSLSILTDSVPPDRRGKAMGALFGAFSAASVLGVPAGLELAHLGGWKAPFFVTAALGVVVAAAAMSVMPPMRSHLQRTGRPVVQRRLVAFLADPMVLLSFASMAVTMMGTFAVVSNISSYVQFNLGYPRARLDVLYGVGGFFSFFAMRLAGRFVDRRGSVPATIVGTILIIAVIAIGFLPAEPVIPVVVIFIGFMTANPTRVVAINALTSRVPAPEERARFMSMQSAVQHLASAIGAGASAWFLHERADRSLDGMPTLALGAIALSLALPFLVAALSRRILARASRAVAPVVAGAAPADPVATS
jgi:predicted MFS family arabinose efflux permease